MTFHTNDDDEVTVFHNALRHQLTTSSGKNKNAASKNNNNNHQNANAMRLAAVYEALRDTIIEQKQKHGDGSSMSDVTTEYEVTPTEVMLASLTALEGTLNNSSTNTNTNAASDAQMPLLQLLELSLPHVAYNILHHQFHVLSRVLRAALKMEQSSSADRSNANAKVRQLSKCAHLALLHYLILGNNNDNAVVSGPQKKQALKLLDETILALFRDARPKVRRAAQGNCLALLQSPSEQSNNGNAAIVSNHVGEYSNAILENVISHANKSGVFAKEDVVKVLHILRFLQQALPLLNTTKQSSSIVQNLLSLIFLNSGNNDNDGGIVDGMIVQSALGALQALVDVDSGYDTDNASSLGSIPTKILASILQNATNNANLFIDNNATKTKNREDLERLEECRSNAAQLMTSCCIFTLQQNAELGTKLFPTTVNVLVVLCHVHSSVAVASTVASELQRLMRFYLNLNNGQQNSGAALEQAFQSLNKLLHHHYRSSWSMCLPMLGNVIAQLYEQQDCGNDIVNEQKQKQKQKLVAPLLNDLVTLHSNVELSDASAVSGIEAAVQYAIDGMGVEQFLSMVSLSNGEASKKNKTSVMDKDRVWLMTLLKSHAKSITSRSTSSGGEGAIMADASTNNNTNRRPRLAFFQQSILSLARQCDANSAVAGITAIESSVQMEWCMDMWSLFPVFCTGPPMDLVSTFPKLAQILVKAMSDKRYPQIVSIVCTGLTVLASSVAQHGTDQEKQTMSDLSTKLLPALFKIVESLSGVAAASQGEEAGKDEKTRQKEEQQNSQRVQIVTDAISTIAKLAPPPFLHSLFRKIMQRLLAATSAHESDMNDNDDDGDDTAKICSLLGLAQGLVSSKALDDDSVALLFRVIKPLVRSDELNAKIQKRSYKVLADLCEHYPLYMVSKEEQLDESIDLLTESIMTCHVSARYMRLKCLACMMEQFDCNNAKQMEVIPKIMGEILLCLKDSNGKTREMAYQLLLVMANARNNITDFFKIVLAGLGAKTPHMRSAAVLAMSRLVYEFARDDVEVQELLPALLSTVLVLSEEKAREILKSVVGYIRISVAAMSPEQLEPLLPDVISALMSNKKGLSRFRSKIKIILKVLVRRYGYDAITPLVPDNDSRLLTHMRKLAERTERRRKANQADGSSNADGAFDDMMESDEEDSDDGRTFMTGVTGFTKMTARSGKTLRSAAMERSVKMSSASKSRMTTKSTATATQQPLLVNSEKDGDVMDMLDSNKMVKNVRFAEQNDFDDFDDGSDDDGGAMEFDAHGRLVVKDPDDLDYTDNNNGGGSDEDHDDSAGGKRRRTSKFEDAKTARANKAKQQQQQQRRKTKELGAAYKSKKAGGDRMKKGQKYEPYAFVPLDGKSYTKKKRGDAVAQMATVVRAGGRKGNASKRKR